MLTLCCFYERCVLLTEKLVFENKCIFGYCLVLAAEVCFFVKGHNITTTKAAVHYCCEALSWDYDRIRQNLLHLAVSAAADGAFASGIFWV